MPEPYRSLLMGGFKTQFRDADDQLIPTEWVRQAQARWKPDGWIDHNMTAMSIDPAGGGRDKAIVCWRHNGWFAPLEILKGEDTRNGSTMAAKIVTYRRNNAPVIVDVGGGYGTDVSSRLQENGIPCTKYHGNSKSTMQSRDGLRFYNSRVDSWWRFKEALDPHQEGGSIIALPDDPEILADITAVRIKVLHNSGIMIEPKEDIRKRLGRSPDKGDAIVMCLAPGDKAVKRAIGTRQPPKVKLGYQQFKRPGDGMALPF